MMNSSSERVNANSAPRENGRSEQREHDVPQPLEGVRPEVARSALEAGVEPLQARRHEQEDERRRVHALTDDRGRRRQRLVKHTREQD